MTDPESTIPPRLPNTPRTWLKRGWAACVVAIVERPDRALVVFMVLLAIAYLL